MIGFVLGWLVSLFIVLLIARMVLDWVGMLATGGGGEFAARARRFTHRLTEPVLEPVRRVLPPVRFGSVGIDLAFTVVFIGALILRAIVVNF